MDRFEIIETIKANPSHPSDCRLFDGDRILVKSTAPEWQHFPAHFQPTAFVDDFERAKNFEVYSDDVWLIGFPRSGTTMTQELLWLIVNDFDFEGANTVNTYSRVQFFDYWNYMHRHWNFSSDRLLKMTRPRVFKSHSPVQFLPDQIWTVKPRIIHISREVKDVAISYYHVRKDTFDDDVGTLEDHLEEILNDKAWFCPYREHVKNYQNMPNYENVFYLTYEELVTDMDGTIRKLSTFLGKNASDENVKKLKEYLNFENMKKNPMTNIDDFVHTWHEWLKDKGPINTFIRKGIIGDHKTCMTIETINRFDEWMAESKNIKSPWLE